jgi:hypothetical protein
MTINVSFNNKRSILSRDSRIIVVIVSIIFIICAAPVTMVIGQETVSQMQDTEIDPAEVSIQITQAKDHIENALNNQGNILRNEIIEQFSFNDVQAQLSQGYQYFIAGNVSAGVTQVEMANEILENTNIAMLQSGQELISLSENKSLAVSTSTREILKSVGNGLTDMGVEINKEQSKISSNIKGER